MVKHELSTRYYNHYLGILQTPADQAPPGGAPAPEGPPRPSPADGAEESPTGQAHPAGSDSLEEESDSIAEVAPIKLKLPPAQEPAPEEAGKKAPGKAPRKFCFIATAAYGSPLAPEVELLQHFRDTYLSRSSLGDRAIRAYYLVSPGLALKISKNQALKQLTRFFLTPIILLLKKRSGI